MSGFRLTKLVLAYLPRSCSPEREKKECCKEQVKQARKEGVAVLIYLPSGSVRGLLPEHSPRALNHSLHSRKLTADA